MAETEIPLLGICHLGIIVDRKYGILFRDYFPQLRIVYYPHTGAPQTVTLYKELTQKDGRRIIIFPRDILNFVAQHKIKHNTVSLFPLVARKCTYSPDFLCDDQQLIFQKIRDIFAQENACACLDLRAGYGKTFIAAALIASLAVRTLYIVPTCALAKQVAQNLTAALDPHIKVEYAKGSKGIAASDAKVCIAVINSVIKWSSVLPSETHPCDVFALVVFDEVHQYCSVQRLQAFWTLQTRYMFAMTATLGERRDGFDAAIARHFGAPIIADNIPGFTYVQNPFKCHVRAVKYYARDEHSQNLKHESTDQVFVHYMIEQFARDEQRMSLIADETQLLLEKNHSLFIFSEERAHLESIAQVLHARGIAHLETALCDDKPSDERGVCAVLFYGGIANETRELALCDRARVILATYSYAGTGISIQRMTAMILATPRYSGMKQIVGRILRRGSDETIPRIVVDLVDQKTCLSRQFYLRRNAYEFYDAHIEKIIVRAT